MERSSYIVTMPYAGQSSRLYYDNYCTQRVNFQLHNYALAIDKMSGNVTFQVHATFHDIIHACMVGKVLFHVIIHMHACMLSIETEDMTLYIYTVYIIKSFILLKLSSDICDAVYSEHQ